MPNERTAEQRSKVFYFRQIGPVWIQLLSYEEACAIIFENQLFSPEEVQERNKQRIASYFEDRAGFDRAIAEGNVSDFVECDLPLIPPPSKSPQGD